MSLGTFAHFPSHIYHLDLHAARGLRPAVELIARSWAFARKEHSRCCALLTSRPGWYMSCTTAVQETSYIQNVDRPCLRTRTKVAALCWYRSYARVTAPSVA